MDDTTPRRLVRMDEGLEWQRTAAHAAWCRLHGLDPLDVYALRLDPTDLRVIAYGYLKDAEGRRVMERTEFGWRPKHAEPVTVPLAVWPAKVAKQSYQRAAVDRG